MYFNVITDSSGPAISLEDVKEHLRILEDDRDQDLISIIYAAEKHIENYIGRTLINKQYRLTLDDFYNTIYLRHGPIVSVESVKYIDTAGVQQTINPSDYLVDLESVPGRITPSYGLTWPSVRNVINSVEIEYTAGYGTTTDDVPEPLKHALKLLIGHFNENTEHSSVVGLSEIPFGVESLCSPYRVTPI